LLSRGDTGFADDYREGLWETKDLSNLMTLALSNDNVVEKYLFGNRFYQLISTLSYSLRANTRKGSRRNIHQHYDLGNEFYSLWLDPSMTYSSALFDANTQNLTDAQHNKYDRILGRLDAPQGSTLEIGCGWGGFAERAVAKGQSNVKGITISKAQHDFATRRLDGAANIVLEDYRDIKGTFDNIVSIEMFEAVGEKYWPVYFEKVASLLKDTGKAVIQTITIDDARFDKYRSSGDAIRSFIFPGGMLPSQERFKNEATKAGLHITDNFAFGQDYARTLEQWLAAFDAKLDEVLALGFDMPFVRLWRFYLASCIAGFKTGRTDVVQFELQHA
jgi:cyclopropane-fatty-acyl-phospholipid synthase